MGTRRRPLAARFAEKYVVDPSTGCWLWTSVVSGNGYGRINLGGQRGKLALAHRVSYQLHIGPIPEGLLVCHRCDVRRCVNPADLFLGTHADNATDKCAKGRANTPHGERNGQARLTWDDVHKIRARLTAGERQCVMVKEYAVSPATICEVASGKAWAESMQQPPPFQYVTGS